MEINPDTKKMIEEKRKQAQERYYRQLEMKRKVNEENKMNNTIHHTSKYFCTERKSTNVMANSNQSSGNSSPMKQPNSFTKISDRNEIKKNTVKPPSSSVSSSMPAKTVIKKTMSLYLLDNLRFMVRVDYEEEFIKKFRNYEGRQYDPVKKTWSFPLKEFERFMADMKELKKQNFDISFDKNIPQSLTKKLLEYNNIHNVKIDLSERLESDFYNKLYPYQREGIIFGIKRDGKLLIADDMGLGKTIQAIGLAKWFRDDWPLIIICPSSLRYQWKVKILEYSPDINEKDIFVVTTSKDLLPCVPITITSYDLMVRMKDRLTIGANRFYRMIIMDESHYIKTDESQRTMVAREIARSCQRIILLSGTPALSRPIELFPQINLIARDIFPCKHSFGVRYCNAKQRTFFANGRPKTVWDYKGADNLDELRIILENTIMIRRLKNNVLSELPTKRREMFSLPMDHLSALERAQLNSYMVMMKKSKIYNDKRHIIMECFQKSAEKKITAVMKYLAELLEKDIKLICFCHHMVMMNGVEQMLRKKRVNFIRIDGSTPAKDRQEACNVFQSEAKYKVALLSLTACATGLNLTAASMVIFTELFWTPGILAQAEDRAHRIGQSNAVRVIYLVAKGTIDEKLWPLLCKKLEILNKTGLSRDTYDGTFNPLAANEDQLLLTDFFSYLDQDTEDNKDGGNIHKNQQPTTE